MKVSDILRVKGHSLIPVTPDETLATNHPTLKDIP